MSIARNSSGRRSIRFPVAAASVTSSVSGWQFGPSRSPSARSRSSRRAAAITRQPLATSASAIATPKPALAPVTSATAPGARMPSSATQPSPGKPLAGGEVELDLDAVGVVHEDLAQAEAGHGAQLVGDVVRSSLATVPARSLARNAR